MATQLGDTLTTRDAFRRAVLDDLVGRAELAAKPIEGGPLDGIEVVSIGTLRDIVVEHLQVELPPPSDKYAEVSTPATIATSAICPECRQPTEIVVTLNPRLTVEGNSTELAIKAKSVSVPHMHGQLPLNVPEGQETIDGAIEDLRLKILGAVYDLQVEHDAIEEGTEPGPAVTLDVIAGRLELATENDRGDLEESLYSCSQLEEPLVEVISTKGQPVTYGLTDAGVDLVDAARARPAADPDEDDDEDEGPGGAS